MKITIESTTRMETINGVVPARVWKGSTESGIAVTLWIPIIRVAAADDHTAFERELSEIGVDRHLVSFDMRMVI